MSKKNALTRLRNELRNFHKDPPPLICVAVNERNMLEWDYLLRGPKDTPYEGGEYHGRVRFPPEYPYAPPEIVMFTLNGRFKQSTPLCLSMSNFHPETWNPAWSVSTILQGLQSFMVEDTHTQGAVEPLPSAAERAALAAKSKSANESNPVYRKMFPDGFVAADAEEEEAEAEAEAGAGAEPSPAEVADTAEPSEGVSGAQGGAPVVEPAPAGDAAPVPQASSAAGGGPVAVGSKVALTGMSARADLDGAIGVLEEIKGTRYHVKLDTTSEVVKVRKGNVTAAP